MFRLWLPAFSTVHRLRAAVLRADAADTYRNK